MTVIGSSLQTLQKIGKPAGDSAAEVTALLTHESAALRSAAIAALTSISSDPSVVVPHLVKVLGDDQWEVRRDASVALGKIGPDAKSAVPVLFRMLDSEDDRDAARGALRAIDDADVDAVPVLLEGLESEDRRRRYYAVSLLRKIGPPAKDALPALKKILEESDSGRMTDFLKTAIESIEGNSDDTESETR
jgi:HEAT repeat protein